MLDHYLRSYVEELHWTLRELDSAILGRVIDVLRRARAAGRQVLVIGNGGSAATASHLACDLGKGTVDFSDPAFRRFRVISLADNMALLSAIGNDLSFEDVFVEQLRMVMLDGDVVVAISASGNSPNLVKAIDYARSRGAETVGLLGFGGGRLARLVDHPLLVTTRNYGIAEDFHAIVMHVLTQYLRRAIAGAARPVAFLDRDGVINERAAPHQYVERWTDFRFLLDAKPLLNGLSELGYELVVITNQQGVGKGIVSPETLRGIHEEMTRALASEGIRLAGIYHCPHLAEAGCFCRKPRPGLIHRALNELPFLVDMERSLVIGDSEEDVQVARAVGLRSFLVTGAGVSEGAAMSLSSVLPMLAAGAGTGKAGVRV